MLVRHGEEIRCTGCGGEVDAIAHNESGESRFAFAVTRRKNGTIVDPPFLATLEAVCCRGCELKEVVLDALADESEKSLWASLPKWEKAH